MPRVARLYLKSPSSYYHIICRLQPELPYLTPSEKEYLLGLLRRLSSVFAIEVISYAFLGTHFHLLLKTLSPSELSEAEALSRALLLFRPSTVFSHPASFWRSKLTDLSEFMKELNQRFSQSYNLWHSRKGHVFRNRFRSIRLEDGKAVLVVSLYIDLNAVRAGLAKSISGYRWVSYAARRAGGGDWLLSLKDAFGLNLRSYGEVLDAVGRVEREGKGKVEENEENLLVQVVRYRAEGLFYGSEAFIGKALKKLPFRRRRKMKAGGLVLA